MRTHSLVSYLAATQLKLALLILICINHRCYFAHMIIGNLICFTNNKIIIILKTNKNNNNKRNEGNVLFNDALNTFYLWLI